MSIKITDDLELETEETIVIIGPNGSGKTRLGVQIAKNNNAERISALRNLAISQKIQLQIAEDAKRTVNKSLSSSNNQPWRPSNELNALITKFKAEDSTSAVNYRNRSIQSPGEKPPETKLKKLEKFWGKHFPEREIDFSSYKPKAHSHIDGSSQSYIISQMSDGERVAILLAARILDASKDLIIVDEPELHLHIVLAKKLWDDFESLRPDTQFIYLTHSLPFAMSRRNAEFLILDSTKEPKYIEDSDNLPDKIVEELLGAASFSIDATKIVFCEGYAGRSLDHSLYSSWFNDSDTAVIPVGSCKEVIKSVEVFNSADFVKGMKANGIIDRDYWPDSFYTNLNDNINVLDFHEVESLLCLPKVFQIIGKHLRVNKLEEKVKSYFSKSQSYFDGVIFNKHLLERVKKRVEYKLYSDINSISPHQNIENVKADFMKSFNSNNWNKSLEEVFQEETLKLTEALEGEIEDFLKYFPGKSVINFAAKELEISKERYIDLVIKILRSDDESLRETKLELEGVLSEYLPKI